MPVPTAAIPDRLRPTLAWWILALAAIGIGGYALALRDARQAQDTVPGLPWLDELHFLAGGVALIVGVFGFRRDLLARHTALHHRLGFLYLLAVFLSGGSALALAAFSHGGMTTHLGFGALAVVWMGASLLGLLRIKAGDVPGHRAWMVRSYAVCCAAITLRVELPLLVPLTGSFTPAYQIVSWLCWVPNLLFAEWYLARTDLAGRRRRRTALTGS